MASVFSIILSYQLKQGFAPSRLKHCTTRENVLPTVEHCLIESKNYQVSGLCWNLNFKSFHWIVSIITEQNVSDHVRRHR